MATEDCVPNSREDTPSSSPKSRVKFLCSHGGKILPRPHDGHLKYVGGETRVVAIPRDTNFSELMKKLNSFFDGDAVLKYQLIPEDLDVLVSVKSDEDLKHMLDEYDRHESQGSPRLRAFLFPSKKSYIDAINGVVGRPPASTKLTPITVKRPMFSISSACTSPKSSSPEFPTNEAALATNGLANRRFPLHKVRSSPALCSFNNNLPSHGDGLSSHHIQKQHYQYYNNGYHSPKPPQEAMAMGMGRAEMVRGQLGHYHFPSRHH